MKIVKYLFGGLLTIILVGGIAVYMADEPLPEGKYPERADQLAEDMMQAVNKPAWDSIQLIQWNFKGLNYHLWDKKNHWAWVKWGDHEVILDINNRKGFIYDVDPSLSSIDKSAICEQAWKHWVNDSFWLNPVVKAMDPGTRRSIVETDRGDALLVTYTSGGATPGDSYLWILDENNRPIAWKFWVSIIPIGGLEFSWENWEQTTEGAWISTLHDGLIDITINDLATATDINTLTGKDVFQPLKNGKDLIEF